MKIKPEHYQHMRAAMETVVKAGFPPVSYYIENALGKDPAMRHRWNLCWRAIPSKWICDTLYPYGVNDEHIDTALRGIVKELYPN